MRGRLGVVAGVLMTCGLAAFGAELRELPLRVHVYATRERVLSRAGRPVAVEGMGKANLYEHGEPRGFDFRFTCEGKVPTSVGYETYPARWKERGRVMEVFVPAPGGKRGMRCEMKVELKDGAYFRQAEKVTVEPAAAFKAWMVKHQYDPEHGKNVPRP